MEQKIFSYLPDSDSSILDQEGIEAIMAVLRDAFFEYFSPLFKFREDVLSTKILWCWKTPEGTLSKRISKMLYKEYKMELNEKTLTQIGNVARQYLPVARPYHMDIVSKITWNHGDFGDIDSCFWTTEKRSGALELITRAEKINCLRFFRENKKIYGAIPSHDKEKVIYETDNCYYTGSSRCWLYKDDDYEFLYNGYGIPLSKMALIYASSKSQQFKLVEGVSTHPMYVNNDEGYIIGNPSTINKHRSITISTSPSKQSKAIVRTLDPSTAPIINYATPYNLVSPFMIPEEYQAWGLTMHN